MIESKTMAKADKGLELLLTFHDSLIFNEFGDKGNSCYKPYRDDDQEDVNEMLAAIRITMKKFSKRHTALASVVTQDIGTKHVSYDWLCKACARILAGQSLEDLKKECELSRIIRKKMLEQAITELHSLDDIK